MIYHRAKVAHQEDASFSRVHGGIWRSMHSYRLQIRYFTMSRTHLGFRYSTKYGHDACSWQRNKILFKNKMELHSWITCNLRNDQVSVQDFKWHFLKQGNGFSWINTMINVVAHCDEANRSRIYTNSLISQQIWNVIEHRWSLQKIQDGNTKITEIHQSSTGRRRQRYEMQYRGSMDRIWSHELLDIGAGPGRQGVIALDEPAVVFEERESLSPESLPPLPVSLDERWVFRWIRHVCCCCFFFLLFESELSSVLPSSPPIQW